jgi:hypothetical protein
VATVLPCERAVTVITRVAEPVEKCSGRATPRAAAGCGVLAGRGVVAGREVARGRGGAGGCEVDRVDVAGAGVGRGVELPGRVPTTGRAGTAAGPGRLELAAGTGATVGGALRATAADRVGVGVEEPGVRSGWAACVIGAARFRSTRSAADGSGARLIPIATTAQPATAAEAARPLTMRPKDMLPVCQV